MPAQIQLVGGGGHTGQMRHIRDMEKTIVEAAIGELTEGNRRNRMSDLIHLTPASNKLDLARHITHLTYMTYMTDLTFLLSQLLITVWFS
jgi:hypothetical protein